MTQLQKARAGQITPQMRRVAEREGIDAEILRQRVAQGEVVIPANINHSSLDPMGVGLGLSTKVNANIGTSTDFPDVDKELTKLEVAVAAGADAVMDLSTGGDIDIARKQIISASAVVIGTVPIYQAMVEAQTKRGSLISMTDDEIFEVIEKQAADGVDFMTVHSGINMEVIERLKREGRVTDVVSRGGAYLVGWMLHHQKENPLYEQYDRILDIAEKYDVTLSLGDGLRPGCLADATDRSQLQELLILGELVERAWERGVQVMVEGPGHVPIDQIVANMQIQKRICKGAPFYVLGPIVTDVAPGYDHITSAIGGAIAASAGADFLCYVTPAEHLGLPSLEDVREGVVASKIAAHAGDLAKKVPGAWQWDLEMAKARKALDWEKQINLSIDPVKARRYRLEKNPSPLDTCTMCGPYCAMQVVGEYLGKPVESC